MNKKSFLINLISGPCAGKSVLAALIFAKLKLKGYVTEYVQEYAKTLVWTKDFDTLNDQYFVSKKQYQVFKEMDGVVDFIVTDGSLYHGIYYNRHNNNNTSNIEKTEKFILDCASQFNNINVFLDRGDIEYEQQGRIESAEEAKEIDTILRHMLRRCGIQFETFDSDYEKVDDIVNYIIHKRDDMLKMGPPVHLGLSKLDK